MRYDPRKIDGVWHLCLDLEGLKLPTMENIEPYLKFSASTYVKVRNDADVEPVNKFFGTLSDSDRIEIAICLLTIHHKILNIPNDIRTNDARSFDLEKYMYDIGTDIVALDTHIHLMDKLKKYVLANIPIGDFTLAGTRPQDSEEMTWYQRDVEDLTCIVMLCKILTPVFGVFMDFAKEEIDQKNQRDKKKEIFCVIMLTKLFDTKYKDMILKLKNYIKPSKRIKKTSQISHLDIFNANMLYAELCVIIIFALNIQRM